MKFQSIRVDAFGTLAGSELRDLENGLSVVYGPNGSGKTTSLQFLRGVFCGFAQARRLKLLPPTSGGPAGGTLTVFWEGDLYEFCRSGEANADHKLHVTRIPRGQATNLASFSAERLPLEQIPLLYTVERGDVHAFDGLVRMALQDGIRLARKDDDPEQRRAIAEAEVKRAQLIESSRLHIEELGMQRQRFHVELQQIQSDHEAKCRLAATKQQAHANKLNAEQRERVNWFHAELQSAESDLREAEESAWQGSSQPPDVTHDWTFPRLRLRRIPSTSHVAVNQRQELDEIDRQVEASRGRLAEIAKSRLEISLRAARIAGSPDMPTEKFLSELRTSLSVMEDSLIALRETTEEADDPCTADAQLGGSSTPQSAVDEIRRRLYGTCEHVSRFELQHVKQRLDDELARLDQEEQAQLAKLQSLQDERMQLTERIGHPIMWRDLAQPNAEQQFCQCSEHGSQEHAGRSRKSAPPVTVKIQPCWPTADEIARLRNRRRRLLAALNDAQVAWRAVRRQAEHSEWPEDVARLARDIACKQGELDGIERELSVAQEQWRDLAETNDVTRSNQKAVEQDNRSRCLKWASDYLARLTAGRYVDIRVTPDRFELLVVDEHGTECTRSTLSRGTLDQVALCLRLALVREYAERGVRFPFVLDDVLVDCDVARLQEAVRLLKKFSQEHNQQILYFTCGTHLVSLFASEGASMRTMPGANVVLPEQDQPRNPPTRWSVHGWIDRRARKQQADIQKPETQTPAADVSSEPAAKDGITTPTHDAAPIGDQSSGLSSEAESGTGVQFLPLHRRQPGGPFWLSLESPVLLVPSIGEQMGRRLSALGIRIVGDLLDLSADDSSIPLKALQVDVGRLHEWQAEAHLLSCVPDLAGPDAQLLVACGVVAPHQLAECDVAQLISRLDRLARRNPEAHIRSAQPTREDLQRWIHTARCSRSLDEPRHNRGGHDQGGRGGIDSPPRAAESTNFRFYLSSESPVVDAPSIGPRMASRLEKLGIITVGDLLAQNPADVASRLKHRRVTAETVTTWQHQARLVCRIPQMRGHDAQVLVACDITEPEQVTRLDARTLLSIVSPFVATKEGQRLLRSSKTPDIDEVADWIDWANHARPLRAA